MIGDPSPLVLQLAATDHRRHSRLVELTRLFDGPVTLDPQIGRRSPDEVAMLVRQKAATAVLAESYPGDLEALRRAVAPVPVLRPMRERREVPHAGAPEDRFSGYGLLRDDGTVEPLADGALAP